MAVDTEIPHNQKLSKMKYRLVSEKVFAKADVANDP